MAGEVGPSMVEEGIRTFGAFGLALTFCVIAIGWLVKRINECEKRNVDLTNTLINLSKDQAADLERNTAALIALKEGRSEEVRSIVAAVTDLRNVLRWKEGAE